QARRAARGITGYRGPVDSRLKDPDPQVLTIAQRVSRGSLRASSPSSEISQSASPNSAARSGNSRWNPAAILAEAMRGTPRDAGIHRVLAGVVVEAVTSEVGEQAGKLIGAAGMSTDQAVDAMVAATALAQEGPVVIVTSHVPHLTALTAGHERIQVVHVDKISR
ncbi:hypothetical protein, partial [Microbispora bryophytorum]|uniref:hypothetical protein n=1 Tax=Microbispora bryophytorum TaxID=1460882 RepID=UPI0033E68B3B